MKAKPCISCNQYPVKSYNIVVGFVSDGDVIRVLFLCDVCLAAYTVMAGTEE